MTDRYTRALAPDATVGARYAAAWRDGKATAEAGEPRRNPWRGLSSDRVERRLAVWWARGYSAGNPVRL